MSEKVLQIMLSDLQYLLRKTSFLEITQSDSFLTLNAVMHSLITTFDPVLNSFIRQRVRTKSSECLSLELTGQASKPYNMTGTHLVSINLTTTSSEATRPTRPKTELN